MGYSDLHVSFQHKGVNYDIDLVQRSKSDQSVNIKGISYAVLGDSDQLATACEVLRSLSLETILSLEDLADRLSLSKDVVSASVKKIDSVGMQLREKREGISIGTWMMQDLAILPLRQEQIAREYWDTYISNNAQKDHSKLIGFLKSVPKGSGNLEELFNQSIDNPKNFDLFLSLFRHLATEHLHAINDGEQLNVMPVISLTDQPVKITNSFLQDLKDYMRDTNFSGVVSLQDSNSVYTITVDPINKPDVSFAMHSVGKMFTGALMLRLIEEKIIPEEALKEPIRLDEGVIQALPSSVRKQLPNTTLHDVMLHKGRYGDYLGNYQDAIEKALREKSSIPEVSQPKDFLAFADEELIPVDKLGPKGDSYSNLGILLVGLSIEHLYNNVKEQLPYTEILRRYVVEPAGMKTFQVTMPEDARVNREDPTAPHISGGPAGGYWCTVHDLLQFGNWLGNKSKEENFMRLLDSYGGEFYSNRDISHGGSIESSSAHISHRIDNGLTIAVMSDMTGLRQASKLAQTIQEHLLG